MKKYTVYMTSLLAACAFFSSANAATQIFVSPNGSDTGGMGTQKSPFATLQRAKSALKSVPKGDVEIVVGAGEYFTGKTAEFNSADLKDIKLTIRGVSDKDGNRPVFIGGKKISAKELQKVTDKNILAKIPSDAKGTLYSIDLKKFGMSDFGKMQQRGFGSPTRTTEMEAFFDLEPMRNAQYPNDASILKIGEVLDEGHIQAIAYGQGAHKPKPDNNIRGAKFKYLDERAARWADAPEAFIRGNLSVGWADDQIKIKKLDPAEKTITLETPHCYGVWSCIPDKNGKIKPGDVAVRGFQVYNLLEELDCVGEYYIDRQNGVFYTLFEKAPNETSSFYFSILSNPFLAARDAKNLTVENIDFTVSRTVNALNFRNCENLKLSNCNISNSGVGVNISGKKNQMLGCKIFNNAMGGAHIYGGDRRTLTSSESLVKNCELYNNARLRMNYSANLGMGGVGIKIGNNYFHDHPHVCLHYSGNDHIIERNIFVRCCKGSSDMGVTYTGRDQSEQGNIIRYNFFSDNLPPDRGAMMCGVYVDDGSSGTLIERNVFCRTGSLGHSSSFGAVYFHGGCDNTTRENVFIECDAGVGQQTWSNDYWAAALKREAHRFYKVVDVNSDVYKKRYPKMAHLFDPETPRQNIVERNRVYATPMSLNGDMVLRNNKPLLPNKDVSKRMVDGIKFWTVEKVKDFFGDDPAVKNALSGTIGIEK